MTLDPYHFKSDDEFYRLLGIDPAEAKRVADAFDWPLEVEEVSKHLGGQHDQSSHGNWAKGRRILPAHKVAEKYSEIAQRAIADMRREMGRHGLSLFGDAVLKRHVMRKIGQRLRESGIPEETFAEVLDYLNATLPEALRKKVDSYLVTYDQNAIGDIKVPQETMLSLLESKGVEGFRDLMEEVVRNRPWPSRRVEYVNPTTGAREGWMTLPNPPNVRVENDRVVLEVEIPGERPAVIDLTPGSGDVNGQNMANFLLTKTVEQTVAPHALSNDPVSKFANLERLGVKISEKATADDVTYSLVPWTDGAAEEMADAFTLLKHEDGYDRFADQVLSEWAGSSGTLLSLALSKSVHRQFGGSSDPYVGRDEPVSLGPEGYPGTIERQRAIDVTAQAMYQGTQEFFKQMGVSHVALYRGVMDMTPSNEDWGNALRDKEISRADTLPPPVAMKSDRVAAYLDMDVPSLTASTLGIEVEHRTISSWTFDPNVTIPFTSNGMLLMTRVPVSRIFGTPITAIGCYDEKEFTVIGSDAMKVTALVMDNSNWELDSWFDPALYMSGPEIDGDFDAGFAFGKTHPLEYAIEERQIDVIDLPELDGPVRFTDPRPVYEPLPGME